jgi:flagellar hook protein FlgE
VNGVTTRTPGHWTVTVVDESNATIGTSDIGFNGSTIDPATAQFTVSTTPPGADPLNVQIDFSGVSSFSSGLTSTIQTGLVDGNAAGSLSTVTVDSTGMLTLTYSNGKTVNLGAVALADFQDPTQLVAAGQGLYKNTAGQRSRLLASASEGVGTVVSGQLETSNVNLTQDFGSLILIQRGFQASSEVISVSNDMIQQLFGIRGHG